MPHAITREQAEAEGWFKPNQNGGLCECGCGSPAPLAKMSDRRRGLVAGQVRHYVCGHNGRGKPMSEAQKAKLRARATGRKLSPETRAKMSEAAFRRWARTRDSRPGGRLKDETGNRYGRLSVLYRGPNSAARHVRWWCDCDCGNLSLVQGADLRRGHTTSCGCQRDDDGYAYAKPVHGHSHPQTPTYNSWRTMIQRTSNPNDPSWKDYGERGISVCERWRSSFATFLADMGERPDGKTLDRIDNDGDYEPGNARWATKSEQRQNRRAC